MGQEKALCTKNAKTMEEKTLFFCPSSGVSPEVVLPFISSPQRLEQPELFAVSPLRPLLP